MGAGIRASRGLSHLTNTQTTRGLTSGVGTSPGRTRALWPAEEWDFSLGRLTFRKEIPIFYYSS